MADYCYDCTERILHRPGYTNDCRPSFWDLFLALSNRRPRLWHAFCEGCGGDIVVDVDGRPCG